MKIAIDARWIFPEMSGIGVYTQELIRRLAAIDPDNEYVLFFNDEAVRERTVRQAGIDGSRNMITVMLPYGVFSPLGQVHAPRLLKSLGVDVYHSTNYMIPFAAFPPRGKHRTKCVATVHDVIPLLFPKHAPRSRKTRLFPVYKRLMIEVGRRADAIIADSRASRTDVIKHLRIPSSDASRVYAVYCGVSERFRPCSPGDETQTNESRQLLYVGRSDPYKNLEGLVRIFARVASESDFPVTLTVAGSPDPRYPEASRLAGELGVADKVRWTGYLADDELAALYRHADVLIHASRYEGFGLQVAEAMASGLPVVCSNAGSIPEVAGDAAIQCDPDDIEGFSAAVARVLLDPTLAEEMRNKGIAQAACFKWENTARETLNIYRSVHD